MLRNSKAIDRSTGPIQDWALHYHRCAKCGGFVPCQSFDVETCAAQQVELSKTCGHVELRPDERHHGRPPALREFVLHLEKLKAAYARDVGIPGDWLDRGRTSVAVIRRAHGTRVDRRAQFQMSGIPQLADAQEELVLSRPHTHRWKLRDEEIDWGAEQQVIHCNCGARGLFTERTRTVSDVTGGRSFERRPR